MALALHLGSPPGAPSPLVRPGVGLEVAASGAWIASEEPGEGWIGERVHVVLDRGARLAPESGRRARLVAGRAYFEVGPGPFVVATALGDVRVLGTAFEVAVDAPSLFVVVAAGRVDAAGVRLEAGEALVDGRMTPAPHEPGAFYRHPALRLTVDRMPVAGEPVTLRFTFANPGRVPIELGGPDGVRAALWLEIVDPSGTGHDVPVPGVGGAGGSLPAGRPLTLGGHAETSFTVRLGRPFGDRGTYRCRALYRPEGQPSLVSDALLLEVR